MSILGRILKRVGIQASRDMTREDYLDPSLAYMFGGAYGEKAWPFDYALAVSQYHSWRNGVGTWVYRGLQMNAARIARQPLRLYVRKRGAMGRSLAWHTRAVPRSRKAYLMGDGARNPSERVMAKAFEVGDDFVEVDPSHPVLSVLRNANPQFNGFDLLMFAAMMESMTGRAHLYPVMDRDLDRPVELWPMPTQYTWLVPGSAGSGRLVDAILYGNQKTGAKTYNYDDVLTFARPLTRDLIYPVGDIEAMWQTLGRYISRRVHEKALFDNMARPDYWVTVKGGSPESVARMKAALQKEFRGPSKTGGFGVGNDSVEVTPLGFAPKDLTPIDPVIEEIVTTMGVPRDKLLGQSTFNNVEMADFQWLSDTIAPALTRWEQSLNSEFGYLYMFGSGRLLDDAFLAFDDPVPENVEGQHARRLAKAQAGIITFDEARADEGAEPLPDGIGEVPRVNGIAITALDEQATATAQSPLFGGGLFPRASEDGQTAGSRDPIDSAIAAAAGSKSVELVERLSGMEARMKALMDRMESSAKAVLDAGELTGDRRPDPVVAGNGNNRQDVVAYGQDSNPDAKRNADEGDGGPDSGAGGTDGGIGGGGAESGGEGAAAGDDSETRVGPEQDADTPGQKSVRMEDGDGSDGVFGSKEKVGSDESGKDAEVDDHICPDDDWPAETKSYRIKVEGLESDLKALGDETDNDDGETGDADDTVRDDEPRTPAIGIFRAMTTVFDAQAEAAAISQGVPAKERYSSLATIGTTRIQERLYVACGTVNDMGHADGIAGHAGIEVPLGGGTSYITDRI